MAFSPATHRTYSQPGASARWALVAVAALGLLLSYGLYNRTAGERGPALVSEASSVLQSSAPGAAPARQPVGGSPAAADASAGAVASGTERWSAEGILFVTEGQAWDAASFAAVDEALSLLPAAVRDRLGNPALGPLRILVNEEGRSLDGDQPYRGAANFFSTGDGLNELVLFPHQRVSTVLHELGHAYNLRGVAAGQYARVLLEAEMQSFMAATGWRVVTPASVVAQTQDHARLDYAYSGSFMWPNRSHFDPLEDFANSFAMYFSDPDGLRAASPERFSWMQANLPK